MKGHLTLSPAPTRFFRSEHAAPEDGRTPNPRERWRRCRCFGIGFSGSLSAFGLRISHLAALPLACGALCLTLTGCHREPPADLVIINGNEPESLDPAIVTGVSEMRLTKALFEGLVRLDGKNGRPVPGLAERWDV